MRHLAVVIVVIVCGRIYERTKGRVGRGIARADC
jgi:hypothetical protein